MMARRTTIHDVAKAAGVSVATVSKAVNGRYGIAPETVTRVLAVVAELGYESSLVASSMRSRKTGVIGVLVADFEPFSAEILKGVGSELRHSHFDVMAYAGSRQIDGPGWEARSLQRLSGTLIDGAIIVTPTVVRASADIPIVAIDPHTGRADLPTVESDSFTGAREATQYLIDLGHTRIGFIAGRPDLRSAALRDAGYRRALSDAGIPYDESLVRVGHYVRQVSREQAHSLLSSPNRPTAVFAANDLSAIATLQAAAELGLEVPRDLSVVGFDDIPEAAHFSPPLTTVRQNFAEIGRRAVDLLLSELSGGAGQNHDQIRPELVVRASTAPPAW